MRKSVFFSSFIAVTFLSVLVSCAPEPFVDKRDTGTLIGVTDLSARWSPAKPSIGDLVHLEASGSRTNELVLPNGETIQALSQDYGSDGVMTRWSFRSKSAGDYALAGKKIFSVTSVAGDSTELKKFDANGLWNGRIQAETKTSQQAAPQMPTTPKANPVQGGTTI